jgi:hypothetical protein
MTPKRKRFSVAWGRYEAAQIPTATLTHELASSFVAMLADDYQADVAVLVDRFAVARSCAAQKCSQASRSA